MTVAFRAGAGITFRPEKSHDRVVAFLPLGWSPGEVKACRKNPLGRPGVSPASQVAEKLLQILFKKIDYLPHRTEIRRG